MNKHISYTTFGTCSKQIEIEIVDDILTDVRFVGGCPGNTLGVSTLVKGMKIDEDRKSVV